MSLGDSADVISKDYCAKEFGHQAMLKRRSKFFIFKKGENDLLMLSAQDNGGNAFGAQFFNFFGQSKESGAGGADVIYQ